MICDASHPVVVDLGVSVSVGPYLLPRAIPLLRERVPGLRMNVRERLTDRPAGQSFVTLGPGFVLTRMAERLAADCGATVPRGYEGNSMDALRLICALREGIALVPALYARTEVRPDEGVVVRPLARIRLDRTLVVAWRQTQDEPPVARLVAECLGVTLRLTIDGVEE